MLSFLLAFLLGSEGFLVLLTSSELPGRGVSFFSSLGMLLAFPELFGPVGNAWLLRVSTFRPPLVVRFE